MLASGLQASESHHRVDQNVIVAFCNGPAHSVFSGHNFPGKTFQFFLLAFIGNAKHLQIWVLSGFLCQEISLMAGDHAGQFKAFRVLFNDIQCLSANGTGSSKKQNPFSFFVHI